MSSPTYEELIAELFPRLTGGIRWGLERTQRLLASVDDPHRSYRVLHVGGTNGKGSVAAHIDSVLRRQGRRVGLYTSPHLCSFRERIRIDGTPIEADALLRAAARLWPLIRSEAPSFFEATTALAFLALAEADVQDVVVEVGLGGRLDATNVVQPDAVVITNVSLDHVQLLGPTLRDIAREKAGIMKPGVPVVTAETGADALEVFRTAAAACRAPLHILTPQHVADVRSDLSGTAFTVRGTVWGDLPLHTRLPGAHQAQNAALAVHALGLLEDTGPGAAAVQEGIAGTVWAGRMQVEDVHGVRWLFDVAHNPAGVHALVEALQALPLPRPVTAVIGVLGDKDWEHMLLPICAVAESVLLTCPPTAPTDRRWDPAAAGRMLQPGMASVEPDFGRALDTAQRNAAERGGSVLVTGSFHTVGDALTALGRCPEGSDAQVAPPAFLQ